jgi:hypothetical protein
MTLLDDFSTRLLGVPGVVLKQEEDPLEEILGESKSSYFLFLLASRGGVSLMF